MDAAGTTAPEPSSGPFVITYPPELPVTQRREDIAEAIRDHQVVVVAGETGSGKRRRGWRSQILNWLPFLKQNHDSLYDAEACSVLKSSPRRWLNSGKWEAAGMASICVIRAGEFFLQTKLVRHMDRTLVSRNVQDFSSGLVRAPLASTSPRLSC